jgi:hypothetical protein
MSMTMQNMLAYTVRSSLYQGNANTPYLVVGYGRDATGMNPANPQDDSYWLVIINAKNPREKVKEWIIPGTQNSSVPSGADTYMNDPDYIFALATQYLSTLHVPQGALYDFLVKYGAGRELQKLEQVNSVLGCGSYGRMSYVLTGQCGPRDPKNPAPTSYEASTYYGTNAAMILMSLMPMPNGGPPYSLCNSYTFHH